MTGEMKHKARNFLFNLAKLKAVAKEIAAEEGYYNDKEMIIIKKVAEQFVSFMNKEAKLISKGGG